MILLEFFKRNNVCQHDKVKPDAEFAYCPDCGELVENEWFLVRCSCCGVKLKGIIKNGQIVAEKKFCHNCGNRDYVIEKINKINFIDIRFAVLIKTAVRPDIRTYTQSWFEPSSTAYGKRYIPCFD